MAVFRCDFDVRGAVVLSWDQSAATFTADGYELMLTNAPPGKDGHVPDLRIAVVGPADDIEAAPSTHREILRRQLDLLSFVTNGRLEVRRCRRVIEWEPDQRKRRVYVREEHDPEYPPAPNLNTALIETARAMAERTIPDFVTAALRCFRNALLARQDEEKFRYFWTVLETIAEGSKERSRLPVRCSRCDAPLTCLACGSEQVRRPMAMEAIKGTIAAVVDRGEERHARLAKVRHQLFHGRSVEKMEDELGLSLGDAVDEIGPIAWRSIASHIPGPGMTYLIRDCYRDGRVVGGALFEIEHTGSEPHPVEAHIPEAEVEVIVRFDRRDGVPPELPPDA